jgi:hypothetical protein
VLSLAPVLAFGGAMTGYAVGRHVAALPAAATVILAAIAFYLVLVAHASWLRVEMPDWQRHLRERRGSRRV